MSEIKPELKAIDNFLKYVESCDPESMTRILEYVYHRIESKIKDVKYHKEVKVLALKELMKEEKANMEELVEKRIALEKDITKDETEGENNDNTETS